MKTLGDLPVGATVEIPVKAEHQSYLGSNIVWKVADKNHAGYPANSVTMITDKIIVILSFDAKEPNNSDFDREMWGNNRYSVSNIKQWLNSSASAGNWYTPQHSTDAPPTKANVFAGYNPYDMRAGFLAMLDDNFVTALMNTTVTVAKNTVTDGGGSETVTSKMFFASNTEAGFANENGIAEGSKLALFSDNASRLAYPTAEAVANSTYKNNDLNTSTDWKWCLRTPKSENSGPVRSIRGGPMTAYACNSDMGVRPLCNLKSDILVSPTPNANGNYTILAYKTPTTIKDLNVGATVEIPVKAEHQSYLGSNLVWKVADKNHAGYPANSVTMITDKIISLLCFDAKEPKNSDSDRRIYGDNRYSVSNIKQWLNSSASAGNWYSPQHSTDAPPTTAASAGYNGYDTRAGFLAMLDNNFVSSLLNTPQITALNTKTDGGGSETVTSKIFLASKTEVGLSNENNIAEGSKLALFSNDTSRLAYPTAQCVSNSNYTHSDLNTSSAWFWWLRTPYSASSFFVRYVIISGALDNNYAFNGGGLRPLCNLKSTIMVSPTPNANGAFVLLFNSPPTAPESITVPEVISGGTNATISWGASTDPDGNLSGYKLERKVNDGSFEQIYSGSARSFSTTITWGWESVTFRVKAYDADGEESAYTTSPTRTIINNATPVISGEDADLGTLVTGFPAQSYTVTDSENDTVTVTVKLDETVLETFTAVLGDEYTVSLSDEQWTKILNGSHTVKILATDGTTTATRTFTFAKNVTFVELETDPLKTDAPAAVAIINIVGAFPEGSILTVEVANNGFDESPTWVDATEKVLAGEKIYIGNTDKTAENWGVKLHVKLERGTATGDCYINSIGGNFA